MFDDKEKLVLERIRQALGEEDAQIEIQTADGLHFNVQVAAKAFAHLSRLEQHRLVMKSLEDVISSNAIHAVQLKTQVIHG